jgi:CobQ-like glutamine amidotransferase family enzyme
MGSIMKRTLSIVWLYHDLMNLYGDRGNVLTLADRARRRDIEVSVKGVSVGEELPQQSDIVFFGGGQDKEQDLVAKDLPSKKQKLQSHLKKGGALLAVCGGYQLLGEYYQPLHGSSIPGLGLLPVYTKAGTHRMIGDLVVAPSTLLDQPLIGFENHSGQTFLRDAQSLGKVTIGHGNNGKDGTEGIVHMHAVGTYLHGPVLPKNPRLADQLIVWGLGSHGDTQPLRELVSPYSTIARDMALLRAQSRKTHGLGLKS